MKRAALLFVTGILALAIQGGVATFVPPPYCPDLGLLVVLAIGLSWAGTAGGFALAAGLGYAADLFSGSLLGQHALLRLLTFGSARVASRRLNLRGPLPLAVFAGGLSLAYGLAVLLVTRFFAAPAAPDWAWLGAAVPHALVNAIFAPWIASGVEWLCAWSGDDDGGRRALRIRAPERSA